MSLQLNQPEECFEIDGKKIPFYREFFGKNIEQASKVIKSGRGFLNVGNVLQRRYDLKDTSGKVKDSWENNYFDTVDGNHRIKDGSAKLVLDDSYVIGLSVNSKLSSGAAILDEERSWESLTGKNVLSLSSDRVKKIHGKSYTTESVKDSKEWNFLARNHKRLCDYADYVFPLIKEKTESDEGMVLYFDSPQDNHTVRAWYVDWLECRSGAVGRYDLGNDNGRFVGFLAPEAQGAQKNLEGKVVVPNLKQVLALSNKYVSKVGKEQFKKEVRELYGG